MLTLSQFRESYPLQLECSLATGFSPQTLLRMSAKFSGGDPFSRFVAKTANSARPVHFLGHDKSLNASVSNLCDISKQIADIEDRLGLSYQAILEKIAGAYNETQVSKIFDLQAPSPWEDVSRKELQALLKELHFWILYINDLDIATKDICSAKSLHYFLRRHPVAGCQILADIIVLNNESWDIDETQYPKLLEGLLLKDSDCILRWIEQPELIAQFNVRSKIPYQSMWSWLMLSMASRTYGYTSNLWATRTQWKKQGYKLRKDAVPAPVFHYYSMSSSELSLHDGDGDEGSAQSGYRIQLVYNASCLTNFNALSYEEGEVSPLSLLKDRLQRMEVDIREGQAACWHPKEDYIEMPPVTGLYAKHMTEAYYATLLPLLMKWAGHPKRMNVGGHLTHPVQFDAFSTLVSELGSANLAVRFGLDRKPCQTSVQRIGNWLDELAPLARFEIVAEASDCANQVCQYLLPEER
ncbi:zincin-like metallopeptidase domain-containing protein [Alteromonas sp. 14N.309.X.WAT.G.H12]|uniref:zincin-like metallopeptidase domain-containing protein n=1 Tax=Alteromonas sp. 14N.309.X.WAT.G.H12 TaxID=3120824 RepID=UPI002FD3454E